MFQETRQCQNCKKDFTIEPDDFDFYEKVKVLLPSRCPQCRYQRRLANRNEWNLYKRGCSLCNKDIISIYSTAYLGPVYCPRCFWSDQWDARNYQRDFDFSRPFFEQFKEFRFAVPRLSITNNESVNSEYTNQSQQNRNCYLVVASLKNENCLYGNWYQINNDCVDCYMVEKCELLYESLNCVNCYNSAFLQNCHSCHSSYFLKNCRGCESCFCCVGLRQKKYYWFNEQLVKDEYELRIKNFKWTVEQIKEMKLRLEEISAKFPNKYYEGRNNTNSSGDYLENNKNARHSFNIKHSEDIKYSQDAWWSKDSMDVTEIFSERDYEAEGCITTRCLSTSKCWQGVDVSYSELCFNCHDLIGCMGLSRKEYCVFNKQYSKEEYFLLKEKVISHMKATGEWGEFFPIETSPFAYNETVAQDYFPLSKDEVISRDWRWYNRDPREYKITIRPQEIPGNIENINESILGEVIECQNQQTEESKEKYLSCATAFRIVKSELEFYKKMGFPIPHKCFSCRRQDRLNMRNPRKLWKRQCQCAGNKSSNGVYTNIVSHEHGGSPCPNTFETSYSPDRPEIVYCEECYLKEVV